MLHSNRFVCECAKNPNISQIRVIRCLYILSSKDSGILRKSILIISLWARKRIFTQVYNNMHKAFISSTRSTFFRQQNQTGGQNRGKSKIEFKCGITSPYFALYRRNSVKEWIRTLSNNNVYDKKNICWCCHNNTSLNIYSCHIDKLNTHCNPV